MILKHFQAEFYTFLAVNHPNLLGLILRVRLPQWINSEYLIPPNAWIPFWNLTSIGVEMVMVLANPFLPAPSTTPVNLILFFSTMRHWYFTEKPTSDDFFHSVHEMCCVWKPKRIVLPTTWETEVQFIRGFDLSTCKELPNAFYLPHYARFFHVLKEEGVTVVDWEGSSTETVDGRSYVELLETYGFDKYDNGPKLRAAWAPFKPMVKGHTCRNGYVHEESD